MVVGRGEGREGENVVWGEMGVVVSARREIEKEREVGLLLVWQARNLHTCIRSSR